MPDGHVEQGLSSFVQLSGGSMQVVDQRNDVHTQVLNVPNLQGTMHERATLSGSRIVGLSGFRMIEGSSQLRVYDTARILRPTMYPNYHTHPAELSGAHNFLGSAGSSVPIIYDNRNHQYHSQSVMPDVHVEQGVANNMQFPGGLGRMVYEGNNEQNQILGGSSIQGQGSAMYQPSTLPSNLTGQQATGSRNMGLLGITITDGTSSQPRLPQTASLLRPERASSLQLQQVPHVPAKRPTMWKNWKGKNGEEYEPPRRGRPRKRFEVGESSSCPKHQKTEKKDSRGIENGTTHALEEANNNTPENLRIEVQISNPTNPSHADTNTRESSTGLYGQTYERNGVPTDPLLRLFKPPPGNYFYIHF
ncbi:hypothetical protein Lal_00002421 [Lupinus albus]|nr:hypothetical protein Lal_00002421 [Lupinus albus]